MDTLTGSVERLTFYNPENGYSVVRLKPERGRVQGIGQDGLITVTGNLPELSPGEQLRLQGKWVNHPKHGLQFQVEICEQILPATVAGMRRYLGSGLVRGIGPRLAERIVAHFGERTLEVIERQPELLLQVPDIGPKRAGLIAAAWEEQKQVKEIMLFLHGYGVSTNLATKIYKQYGDRALDIVRTDPYQMARDIYGVGFKTADRIAQALGLPADHPRRIEAGLIYALNQATDEGHVFMPQPELVESAAGLLEVTAESVSPAIKRLEESRAVYVEHLPIITKAKRGKSDKPEANAARQISEEGSVYGEPAVYLAQLYYGESGVAERLSALASAFPTRLSDLPPAFIHLDPQLSEQQQAAIRMSLSQPLSVLTGGPGTGKTTALKALIEALEVANKHYSLASPTGRAAKRLSQATGRPASTIHRLLGFSPGEGFKYDTDNPLPVDFVVVDEASMLDLYLAHHLLRALLPGIHLLLVGDVDQLPSVGAGDVLRDIIASGMVPVTRLSVIFRQAEYSHIITNAHRINQGQMPLFPAPGSIDGGDFFLFPAETPEEAANWLEEVVCTRIPQKFGYHPCTDIQVLSPMYRGPVGVTMLNERLQARLNPPEAARPEKRLFGQVFRTGDKVMQVLNNYEKDVFNGDIGTVFAIDLIEHSLVVEFEGRGLIYDWSEADQLVLAYAVSVHKSQGAEYPVVVLPLVTQHYMMLQRNLLYTAVTRAKRLCVLVGSRRAIGIAVRNDQVARRYTALNWRLRAA
jgi:exodeoxyribonuclease V alpha subunit